MKPLCKLQGTRECTSACNKWQTCNISAITKPITNEEVKTMLRQQFKIK
jgi:hypothetical protein